MDLKFILGDIVYITSHFSLSGASLSQITVKLKPHADANLVP